MVHLHAGRPRPPGRAGGTRLGRRRRGGGHGRRPRLHPAGGRRAEHARPGPARDQSCRWSLSTGAPSATVGHVAAVERLAARDPGAHARRLREIRCAADAFLRATRLATPRRCSRRSARPRGARRAGTRRQSSDRHPGAGRLRPRWPASWGAPRSLRAPGAATSASPSFPIQNRRGVFGTRVTSRASRILSINTGARGLGREKTERPCENGRTTTQPDGSRLPGFYKLSVEERRELLRHRADLSEQDLQTLEGGGLDTRRPIGWSKTSVGVYALPLGLGLNFRVNGRDVLVPMAVEEPSVIAAASNAARMVRQGGGFVAEADEPVMTAQIENRRRRRPEASVARLEAAAEELLGAGARHAAAAGPSGAAARARSRCARTRAGWWSTSTSTAATRWAPTW